MLLLVKCFALCLLMILRSDAAVKIQHLTKFKSHLRLNAIRNPFSRDGSGGLMFPRFLKKDKVKIVKEREWEPTPYSKMTVRYILVIS